MTIAPFLGSVEASADSPLVQFGDNSLLYITAEGGFAYSDNIFASKNRVADTVATGTIGLHVETGRDSINQFNLVFKETFQNYIEHDDMNSQIADVFFSYVFAPKQRLRVAVNGSFKQSAQNDNIVYTVGDIVHRYELGAGLDLNYQLSTKISLSTGFSYYQEHFENYRHIFNDRESYTVPLSVSYAVTEKIFTGLSYSYTYSDIHENSNQNPTGAYWFQDPGTMDQHYLGLNVKGDISTKLNLRADFGFSFLQTHDRSYSLDERGNGTWGNAANDNYTRSNFNFSLGASYQASSRALLTLIAGRRFQVGGQAQDLTNTFVRFSSRVALFSRWYWVSTASYAYQDFNKPVDRVDHVYSVGTGISYIPNKYWQLSLGYRFLGVDSKGVHRFEGYGSNIVEFSAKFKY